jgi:2-keto-4-pentenoate hydratase/2-oxohepta-3-ene-1,7-dioic acid hydratase in catechol pathway
MSGDGDEVVERADIATLDYEPELCYVAGKRANGVRKAEAMDYISGRYVVFEPGDLIAMGAPSGVAVGRRTRRSFIRNRATTW